MDQAAEANAAHVKRRLAKHVRGLNFHARTTKRTKTVAGSPLRVNQKKLARLRGPYWRALRRLSGVAGTLLRNGLMSSPPRRV